MPCVRLVCVEKKIKIVLQILNMLLTSVIPLMFCRWISMMFFATHCSFPVLGYAHPVMPVYNVSSVDAFQCSSAEVNKNLVRELCLLKFSWSEFHCIFASFVWKSTSSSLILLRLSSMLFPCWFPPGVRLTKQVQQTLSVTLNSELIYSEIGNSEFPVPEQQIWVGLLNSE